MTLLLGSDEKGVFTRESSNVKREIERKFSKSRPKLGKFWRFWGSGGQGFHKVAIFTPKGTSLREPTPFEPFCVKIGRGV